MFRGLVTALRTLTLLPVPGREAESVAAALYWFPLVGLLLGLLEYGAGWGVGRLASGTWALGMATAALVAGAFLTRGLHLDGLADWADAQAVLEGKEKALEVMKDPRIGALGAVALVCVLLAKWAALARLAEAGQLLWIVPACIISRAMQVGLAASLPYARPEGGTVGALVQAAGFRHWLAVMGVSLLLLVPFGGLAWAALFGAGVLTHLFGESCRQRHGGVTGDLLGACSELTELLVLWIGALAVGPETGLRTLLWPGVR
jgi:adenosylcobinamide-GDP ribazoletransferase